MSSPDLSICLYWDLLLAQIWMMYDMVIWPVMIYGAIAWHQSWGQNKLNQRLDEALASFQNQCLWIMTEAYQATPASILETEAHVPLLNLYLDFMMAQTIQCLENSEMAVKIERACQEIHHYLQTCDQNQWKHLSEYIHPKSLPKRWQTGWIQNDQTVWIFQFWWESQWWSQRVLWERLYSQSQEEAIWDSTEDLSRLIALF